MDGEKDMVVLGLTVRKMHKMAKNGEKWHFWPKNPPFWIFLTLRIHKILLVFHYVIVQTLFYHYKLNFNK
jgi:hypothetical protein